MLLGNTCWKNTFCRWFSSLSKWVGAVCEGSVLKSPDRCYFFSCHAWAELEWMYGSEHDSFLYIVVSLLSPLQIIRMSRFHHTYVFLYSFSKLILLTISTLLVYFIFGCELFKNVMNSPSSSSKSSQLIHGWPMYLTQSHLCFHFYSFIFLTPCPQD